MTYNDDEAERLEAVYRGADIVRQREETRRCLALKPGDSVIDIGSGPGFLAQEMAQAVGPSGRICGVDLSEDMIRRSKARNEASWVDFIQADATDLPMESDTFDAMVSTQVAEYIPDTLSFCQEAFRVLKPGGRGLIIATDWNTVAWHSDSPERMNRVMAAFRPHCAHADLPRTLAPVLRKAGFNVNRVTAFPIINIDWKDDNYSKMSVELIAAYVRGQGGFAEEDVAGWEQEFPHLASEGRYYYSNNRLFFHISKPVT